MYKEVYKGEYDGVAVGRVVMALWDGVSGKKR